MEKNKRGINRGLSARLIALLGIALTVIAVSSISAFAATPSSRFATYSGGVTGEVSLPPGYPSATVTVTQDEVDTVSSDNLSTSPFKTFFTQDGAPATTSPHLSLQGGQSGSGTIPNVITITFDEEVPAEHLGINFGDVDVETVVISMSGGTQAQPTPVTPTEMGFQSVYNSATGSTTVDVPGIAQDDNANTFTLVAPGSTNTNGASAWFLPTAGIREITLTSTYTVFGRFYVWFAAIRPEATLNPVPATYTLGDDPLPGPFAALEFPTGIIDSDFPDSDREIMYSVSGAVTTGCALTGNPPTLTATTAGTCTLTADVATSADFVGASETIAVAVQEPSITPPAPPPSENTRQPSATPSAPPAAPSPELVATGAPPHPLWALVAGGIGVGLLTWARFTSRQSARPRWNQPAV